MAKPSKIELEMFVIAQRWAAVLKLAQFGLYAWIAWLIYDGVLQIIEHSPEQIGAFGALLRDFSGIFTKANAHIWGGWLLAAGFGVAWKFERNGKKRAVRKLGHYRKEEEDNDPGERSSSGLSETGDTPEE